MASLTATYPRKTTPDHDPSFPFEARANADGHWAPVASWRVVSPWTNPEGAPAPMLDMAKARRTDDFNVRTPFEALEAYDRLRARWPRWNLAPAVAVFPSPDVYTIQVRVAPGTLSDVEAERLMALGWQRDGADWRTIA